MTAWPPSRPLLSSLSVGLEGDDSLLADAARAGMVHGRTVRTLSAKNARQSLPARLPTSSATSPPSLNLRYNPSKQTRMALNSFSPTVSNPPGAVDFKQIKTYLCRLYGPFVRIPSERYAHLVPLLRAGGHADEHPHFLYNHEGRRRIQDL